MEEESVPVNPQVTQELGLGTQEEIEAKYQPLKARFQQYLLVPEDPLPEVAGEANNDDNNADWAVLDVILEDSCNDAASAVHADANADDTWIMLGSDGS